MKRTDTIFKATTSFAVAMAITAGPAFGSTGATPGPTAWSTSIPSSAPAQTSDPSSLNAKLHEAAASVTSSDQTSIAAALGGSSANDPAVPAVPVGSSVNSIVGAPDSAPGVPATIVREQSGFDWSDALLGALGALFLVLLPAAAAHTLRRRGRISLGSQV